MQNSLDVLSESLDKKLEVLHDIEKYNEEQRRTFEKDDPDLDIFDQAIEQKGELIERLTKLDDGFELLYSRIADELKDNKALYADKIREIQEKISEVTELSLTVQASEARNKALIEQYFVKKRQGIKTSRVTSKAAYDYYKNMVGVGVRESQFLDSKK